MTDIERKLIIASQKAHFGEYNIAIKQLIEVIEEQQKQIKQLVSKGANNGNSKSNL